MEIDKIAMKIAESTRITVLTGAGISKASGIPTFRGKDGLWHKYSPTELATMGAFMKNPKLVWEWYNYRRKIVKEAKPNQAHLALVKFEELWQDNFTLVTQNVDSLHRMAGSKNIYELHGNIFEVRCLNCGKVYYDDKVYSDDELPPTCKFCSGRLRPNVVWFGENLDRDVLNAAMRASATCDCFIAVGTSGVVQPAASLPKIAHDRDAFVIEVNVDYSGISIYADEVLLGKAEEMLPQLVEKALELKEKIVKSKLSFDYPSHF